MTFARAMRIFARILACAPMLGLVDCSGDAPVCADGSEIWFQRVLDSSQCEGCDELRFSTPVLNQDRFSVRADPDYVLDSCGISQVMVNPDVVTLVLSPAAYAPLAELRNKLVPKQRAELVLIRLAGAAKPLAVFRAKGIHRVLTFVDFEGPEEIDQFVGSLRLDASAVIRSDQHLLPDPLPETPAERAGEKLLRELEEEFPDVEHPSSVPSR